MLLTPLSPLIAQPGAHPTNGPRRLASGAGHLHERLRGPAAVKGGAWLAGVGQRPQEAAPAGADEVL
jgi:hypothetical protein